MLRDNTGPSQPKKSPEDRLRWSPTSETRQPHQLQNSASVRIEGALCLARLACVVARAYVFLRAGMFAPQPKRACAGVCAFA